MQRYNKVIHKMMQNSENMKVGDIDERGFLNNLSRKGFTHAKSLSEGHGNAVDFHSVNISYHVEHTIIKEVDDGCGMDQNGLKDAFSVYRQNHSNDRSIGVSGIGMKAHLNISGNKKPTKTVTKMENGPYLTAEAPWDTIHREGRYTNMINIRSSNLAEVDEFNHDRANSAVKKGTTHIFNYNSALAGAIAQQFETPATSENFVPEDQFSVIYGRFPQTVTFHHFENPQPKVLQNYNYFHGEQTEFYGGIQEDRIIFWQNASGDERFIWTSSDGNDYEIARTGRGWGNEVRRVTTNLSSYETFGEATLISGIRRDPEYFDDEHPVMPGGAIVMHPYDQEHVGGQNFEFLAKMPVIRNGQLIGVTELPGLKISSARGNGESMCKLFNVHCEFRYDPLSTQDNKQDLIVGVQECKTQYICSMPPNLLRLIKGIKFEKAQKIWNYFKGRCAAAAPPPVPVPVVVPIPVPQPVPVPVPEPIVDYESESDDESVEPEHVLVPHIDSDEDSDEDSDAESEVDVPNPVPVDVRGHRRGLVRGIELRTEMQRVFTQIQPDSSYSDPDLIQIFNILSRINIEEHSL